MLLENTNPVNYSADKITVKTAELQAKLDLKPDGDEFEIKGFEYKEGDSKSVYVRVLHKTCGKEFHVTASKFFNNVSAKCPECGNRVTLEDVRKMVEDDTEEEYTLLSTSIKNAKDSVEVRHNTCGKEYKITIRRFKEGSRCNCKNGSTGQKTKTATPVTPVVISSAVKTQGRIDFENFLKQTCSEETVQIDTQVPGTNSVPSFYIPELKTAFYYTEMIANSEEGSNGVCNRKFFTGMMHDLHDNANVRLVCLTEEEWLNKQQLVKLKITHILGKNKGAKIYARKCYVKEIPSSIRCPFLNKYHIQGKDSANVSLGLYYKNKEDNTEELVAVMSFVKPRKAMNGQTDKYDYELSRFAAVTDRHVVGGFGKLMKYFRDNYQWDKLLTYADLRWTSMDSSVYKTNGFTHTHNSDASYGYVDMSVPVPTKEFRFKYRKSELEFKFPQFWNNGNATEKEIMKNAGYARLWDCGNLVFELER